LILKIRPSKRGIALLCLIEKIEEIRAALSQPDWPSICNLVSWE
jgi:hypothetical protein